jgi:AraC family transcriptional regulator, regulatory protein of adaptative response / methylated-DNA-[protein]-cysteine methyltransferase
MTIQQTTYLNINFNKTISCGIIETPVGNMIGCASEEGIVMLLFEKEAHVFLETKQLSKSWNISESKNNLFLLLESQLENYFKGTLKNFNIKLDPQGSAFQKRIWSIVQQIPYGTTLTYKDIALKTGNTDSIRAVAAANARNNILLLIPCHRVIGAGNKLTGFRGGIEKKLWLLDHERSNSNNKNDYQLF